MKAIRLLVMLTVAVLSSVSGYAYEPLVQEGKTWKHTVYAGLVGHYPSSSEVSMRIGSAEEIHGKTYYPLRDVETNELYAYLRQEGNKVYSYMDICEEWGDVNGESEEYLVYDFDANPGDTYESISVADNVAVDLTGYCGSYSKEKVTVSSVDNIMINGVERKRMIVKPEYGTGLDYEIIEGIGINWGYVHLPEFGPFCTGTTALVKINEVTDAEGNVLFTKADFDAPAYRPLVQEGKTWNYDLYIDTFGDTEHQTATLKFGTPEILFGEEYFPIVDNDEYKVGYMRQTGNKIYTLVDGDIINELYPYPDGEHVLGTGEEALVCDFSASEGYKYMMSGYPKFLYDVTVTQADKILVNGIIRKRIVVTCNDIKEDGEIIFVEGIGSNKGYLCLPQFLAMVHGTGSALVFLNNVTDAEGNVIFTAADFDAPAYSAGVPEVGFDTGGTRIVDNKMYDLNGREIRNPLPGTVYIQNGEKHVAK